MTRMHPRHLAGSSAPDHVAGSPTDGTPHHCVVKPLSRHAGIARRGFPKDNSTAECAATGARAGKGCSLPMVVSRPCRRTVRLCPGQSWRTDTPELAGDIRGGDERLSVHTRHALHAAMTRSCLYEAFRAFVKHFLVGRVHKVIHFPLVLGTRGRSFVHRHSTYWTLCHSLYLLSRSWYGSKAMWRLCSIASFFWISSISSHLLPWTATLLPASASIAGVRSTPTRLPVGPIAS